MVAGSGGSIREVLESIKHERWAADGNEVGQLKLRLETQGLLISETRGHQFRVQHPSSQYVEVSAHEDTPKKRGTEEHGWWGVSENFVLQAEQKDVANAESARRGWGIILILGSTGDTPLLYWWVSGVDFHEVFWRDPIGPTGRRQYQIDFWMKAVPGQAKPFVAPKFIRVSGLE